jgi:hypothetical protein
MTDEPSKSTSCGDSQFERLIDFMLSAPPLRQKLLGGKRPLILDLAPDQAMTKSAKPSAEREKRLERVVDFMLITRRKK